MSQSRPDLPGPDEPQEDLSRRLDLLERENDRLRRQIEDIVGPDNPCFNRLAFQKALRFYMIILMLPLQCMFIPLVLIGLARGLLPSLPMIGPVPLVDFAGLGTSHPGMGLGIVAFGGLALGAVACGGGAVDWWRSEAGRSASSPWAAGLSA